MPEIWFEIDLTSLAFMVPLLALVASEIAAQGGVRHLKPPLNQARRLREAVVLIDLVQQQHILPGSQWILAQRVHPHAARQLRRQLLLARLRLIERTDQIRHVRGIHSHRNPPKPGRFFRQTQQISSP
jgi:hypothetical protein